MPINSNYNEEAIVEAIATALDNFYTNLISNIDKLNIKKVMKRKNPYLFRAKAMNGAAQIIDAILAAFVSSSEETIFGNVFFEPIATAAAQGQKALAEGVDIMVERDNTIYAIAVKSGTSVFNADSRKKQEQNFMAASKLAQQAKKRFVPIVGYGYGNFMRVMQAPELAGSNGTPGEYGWDGLPGTYFMIDPREELILIYMQQIEQNGDLSLRRKMRQIVYGALEE